MSRIGKKPIELPKGVTVTINGQDVDVKGPKGQLHRQIHNQVDVALEGNKVNVSVKDNMNRKFQGLTRTLVNNMVLGVSQGFSKRLKLVGVGYRAASAGKKVNLSLGFSHPIEYEPPTGVEIKVDQQTVLVVSGADKELVGQVAAKVRGFRPPEPYHGKGVRYEDEKIITKVGKAAGKK
jgi:large subunit ribosomal protein L6